MTADIEKEEFVSGQFRAAPGHPGSSAIMLRARTQLWKTFCGTKMKAGVSRFMQIIASCLPFTQFNSPVERGGASLLEARCCRRV